jgi:hypothetical protein
MRQSVDRLDKALAGMLILLANMQVFLINLIARIFGNQRMARAMQSYMAHPTLQQGAAAMGVPDIAERAGEAMAAMKAHTPEALEWDAFIQNYGANPRPDEVPALFTWILETGALEDRRSELPMAAAVIALAERYPDLAPKWKASFPGLFQFVVEICVKADQERAGWNDYYMCRWFILRDDDTVREIVRRTQRDGDIGATASWMALSVGHQYPDFASALERCGFQQPTVDAEFDCGDTNVTVGPGPHQITRMAKPSGFPAIVPTPYVTPEAVERARQAAVALERKYNDCLSGAVIERIMVHEDPVTQETAVAIHTTVGAFGFSSTRLHVSIEGLSEEELREQLCNSR